MLDAFSELTDRFAIMPCITDRRPYDHHDDQNDERKTSASEAADASVVV